MTPRPAPPVFPYNHRTMEIVDRDEGRTFETPSSVSLPCKGNGKAGRDGGTGPVPIDQSPVRDADGMTRAIDRLDLDTADSLRTMATNGYWRRQPVRRIARMLNCDERQVRLAMKRAGVWREVRHD